jgi:hypothetical protein
MNSRGGSMKYDNLVVLIRHDSAEIWVFGYSITLGSGTKIKWPAPVFWVFRFVYSMALLRFFHHYQAWLCLTEGTYKAAAPKNEVQVRIFTERGNEQITPWGRWEKWMNSWKSTPRCENCAWLSVSIRSGFKNDHSKCSWNFIIKLFIRGIAILVCSAHSVVIFSFGKFGNSGLRWTASTHLKGFSLTTKHDFGLMKIETVPWLSIPRFGCRKLVYLPGGS